MANQIINQTNSQLIILSFKQPFKQVHKQVNKPNKLSVSVIDISKTCKQQICIHHTCKQNKLTNIILPLPHPEGGRGHSNNKLWRVNPPGILYRINPETGHINRAPYWSCLREPYKRAYLRWMRTLH